MELTQLLQRFYYRVLIYTMQLFQYDCSFLKCRLIRRLPKQSLVIFKYRSYHFVTKHVFGYLINKFITIRRGSFFFQSTMSVAKKMFNKTHCIVKVPPNRALYIQTWHNRRSHLSRKLMIDGSDRCQYVYFCGLGFFEIDYRLYKWGDFHSHEDFGYISSLIQDFVECKKKFIS